VLCLPVLYPAAAVAASFAGPLELSLLLGRELLVGATVGFCAATMFRAAEAAGRLADVARGANLAEVLSPISDERTSPTGDLYLLVAIIVFLELGGLRVFATALARSYEAIPVGAAATFAGLHSAAELLTACVGKLLESAIGLAAPVVVALWLGDVALGLIGRAAPQIPITFVGMPAKALLGLGAVLLGIGAVDAAFVAGFSSWGVLLERAFAIWRNR
jgi:type III secretory pathway component EscT